MDDAKSAISKIITELSGIESKETPSNDIQDLAEQFELIIAMEGDGMLYMYGAFYEEVNLPNSGIDLVIGPSGFLPFTAEGKFLPHEVEIEQMTANSLAELLDLRSNGVHLRRTKLNSKETGYTSTFTVNPIKNGLYLNSSLFDVKDGSHWSHGIVFGMPRFGGFQIQSSTIRRANGNVEEVVAFSHHANHNSSN